MANIVTGHLDTGKSEGETETKDETEETGKKDAKIGKI